MFIWGLQFQTESGTKLVKADAETIAALFAELTTKVEDGDFVFRNLDYYKVYSYHEGEDGSVEAKMVSIDMSEPTDKRPAQLCFDGHIYVYDGRITSV